MFPELGLNIIMILRLEANYSHALSFKRIKKSLGKSDNFELEVKIHKEKKRG